MTEEQKKVWKKEKTQRFEESLRGRRVYFCFSCLLSVAAETIASHLWTMK